MNDYQKFIATSRYARWLEEEGRRESYDETVDRYVDNVIVPAIDNAGLIDDGTIEDIRKSIKNMEVMPSMRAMMTAGPALNRDNTCAFNCSYLPVDNLRAFDEAMYILLCGTGVGFSVERQEISKLPEVPLIKFSDVIIKVGDSKEGWAESLRLLLETLFNGLLPRWDTRDVRDAGSRLITFGGRASGPAPLIELFDFVVATVKAAQGRKLTSLECHDIMCKIGEVVVVGGVRRSAMISLSNLSDQRMSKAKSGAWYENDKQRALANNSTAYTEKPDMDSFIQEWHSLVSSRSGERGMFNRMAAIKQVEKFGRRKSKLENSTSYIAFGTNPCSEIILRPYQFCNLTEVVARVDDTFETLEDKVYIAVVIGTIQASLTHFPYLRDIWRKNTEEEALLGVSITGIMDSPYLRNCTEEDLNELRVYAVEVNEKYSKLLGIKPAAAITCVKPSGTVSQLTDTASGIHARYADYYIRTVRGDNKDPLTEFMKWVGVPSEPCVMKPDNTTIFSFPMKSPEGAIKASDWTALEQLEFWIKFQRGWCEHKPSVTINVREHEWMEVGAWVYKNFDEVSGISFLPYDDNVYQQAPYQEITEADYVALEGKMPKAINWELLSAFEHEDHTSGSQTFACSSGSCEIVDIN